LSKKLKIPMPTAHPLRNHPTARTPSDKGFALVVTLSLMLLLLFTVIAVDSLLLSSILLRASTQDQAVAQANARETCRENSQRVPSRASEDSADF
jgi:Tfp pilus assembly protein PilX